MLRQGRRTNPTYRTIDALARFFGVSPAYFFDASPAPETDLTAVDRPTAPPEHQGRATRFTFNASTWPPQDRRYDSTLVAHVELIRPDRWWVRQGGEGGPVYNAVADTWDTDWAARHAEDDQEDAYFADLDEAIRRAQALLVRWNASVTRG
ncbi:hypothetical protein F0L68_40385 [Solihabitans fulvus]|uniref:HTH cro/C1-type domain-containing protein n=2 Tax=Solihabitans fulvus TaxID=1892852 RepID=A0A5B2W8N1_9PSEU|nr:hypothetical protein F0L68_40385 [Solihabitans fulvus]